jgi:hypothetical protein
MFIMTLPLLICILKDLNIIRNYVINLFLIIYSKAKLYVIYRNPIFLILIFQMNFNSIFCTDIGLYVCLRHHNAYLLFLSSQIVRNQITSIQSINQYIYINTCIYLSNKYTACSAVVTFVFFAIL